MKASLMLIGLVLLAYLAWTLLLNVTDTVQVNSEVIPHDTTSTEIKKQPETEMNKSEDEWKKILSEDQYCVLREKATERAFTGKYYKHNEKGMYLCAACGNELFSSETKYESGSGWPSYWAPVSDKNIILEKDFSHGMIRTEVVCAKCGGHLGHIFDDGPEPTGQRYCINSVSLKFNKAGED